MTPKAREKLLLQTLLFVRSCPKIRKEVILQQKPKPRMLTLVAYIDEVFAKLGYRVETNP